MARRDVSHYLADMLETIAELEKLVAGKTLAAYRKDFATRRAVERCIEIISEATRHLPASATSEHPEIPWKQVRGVGNVLRHEYNKVVDGIIWSAATNDMKPLKTALVAMSKAGTEAAKARPRRAKHRRRHAS